MDLQHKPMETLKRDKKIKPKEIFENYNDNTKPKKSNKSKKVKRKKSIEFSIFKSWSFE